MAKLFFSFGRSVKNGTKSCGISSNAASFSLLKKLEFTNYVVSRYCTVLPYIDLDDNVQTSKYLLLVDGKSESRRTTVAKKLVELYQIEHNEASRLVDSNPVLAKVGSANLTKAAQAAESVGILKEIILKYPSILAVPTGDINYAVKLITRFCSNINEVAPLLTIPIYQLTFYTGHAVIDKKIIPQESRILYFSENLEYDVLSICEAFYKHQYLFVLPFARIHTIMTLLLDANIKKPYIFNDLWIFRHCSKTIEKRIEITKQAGIERIKPWMLRCSDKTLSITLNRHLKNKSVLGSHLSISSYLRERLKCSEEEISVIIKRHPVLEKTNIHKLKTILDYLYADGYTSVQILSVPRVLTHSFNTLRTRNEELHMLGYNGKSLLKLCMAKRSYNEFVSKLSE